MSRKKTPDASKLTRTNVAPYTLRKSEASDTKFDVAKDKGDKKVEAKVDVKTLAASDGKVDAKFDDVKSGPVNVEATDGAPKPGDGPKSATHNEAPTEQPR